MKDHGKLLDKEEPGFRELGPNGQNSSWIGFKMKMV
jgi:hypothetical protein